MVFMTNSAIKIRRLQYYSPNLLTRLYMILILSTSSVTSLTFDFPNVQQYDTNGSNSPLKIEGDAVISNQFMIQLTKDEVGSSVSGVTYREPFLLRDNTTGKLADFTTSFKFTIDSKSSRTDHYAEGLVFFLAPNRSVVNSALGKGRASSLQFPVKSTPVDIIKLRTQYPFVAVEFDIYRNHERMSNSVDSCNTGIIVEGRQNSTTATISYNSTSKIFSVSLLTTTCEYSGVYTQQVTSHCDYMLDLEQYLPDRIIVGFSAATGTNPFALHKIISWNFTSTSLVDHESLVPAGIKKRDESWLVSILVPGPSFKAKARKHMIPLLVLIRSSFGWFVLAALLGLGVLNSCKHRATRQNENLTMNDSIDVELQKETRPRNSLRSYFTWAKGKISGDDQNPDTIIGSDFEKRIGPRKYSYRELVRATDNFEEAKIVGHGGFGVVYKGFIKDLESHVAVKKRSTESQQDIEEYVTEVKITSQLRHRNLVKLIGWCNEKKRLLLVYEFVHKGSLENHLFGGRSLLSWEVRYKIVQDLASVIHYLHEEWDQCVLHMDIKTTNILLDLNFNMKLADFGLAQLMDHGESSGRSDFVVGTMGYMPPEYMTSGEFSKKVDVFSFGVVALEIACGRSQRDEKFISCHVNVVEWIWGLYGEGKVIEAADPKLRGVFDGKEMECLMIVGLWCAHPDYTIRPSIQQAISVLNFYAPLPSLPSEMPRFQSTSTQSGGQSDTYSQESSNFTFSR